jgi:hypothetical protein
MRFTQFACGQLLAQTRHVHRLPLPDLADFERPIRDIHA